MKRTIRISERELHKLINESIRRVLSEDQVSEYYEYGPSNSDVEVETVEILWSLMRSMGIDDEEYEATFDLLEKEMPVVYFETEFDFDEPDDSVGKSGGWYVKSIKMCPGYKEYLDELFQKGLIPQECYKPLFKELEDYAYSEAEDRAINY